MVSLWRQFNQFTAGAKVRYNFLLPVGHPNIFDDNRYGSNDFSPDSKKVSNFKLEIHYV